MISCFSQKTGSDVSYKSRDNLHEMSTLFPGKNKKNISKCCLLKILRRVLRVKEFMVRRFGVRIYGSLL